MRVRAHTVGPGRLLVEKDYRVVAGQFTLDACLQKSGQRSRVWVQWEGPDVQSTESFFVYTGQPSSGECARPKVWGIFVGISDYASVPLSYAHKDAERMFGFWNTQPDYERRRLVLVSAPPGGPARLEVISNGAPVAQPAVPLDRAAAAKALRNLIGRELFEMTNCSGGLANSDLLVIYLAGHGVSHREGDVERWSFLPSDGNLDVEDTLIGAEWLGNALANMNKASSILLLVDACRHYATSHRGAPRGEPISQLLAMTKTLNLAAYVGAAAGDASFEFPRSDLMKPAHPLTCQQSAKEDDGGGAFTHVLLRLLESEARDNDDGSIHALTLAAKLREGVRKICRLQDVTFSPSTRSFRPLFLPR